MENGNLRESRLNNWVSLSLKVGVAISITLTAIGLVLIGIAGAEKIEPAVSLAQLPQEILKLNATAIITLGILILLLTPIIQVIVAIVLFSIARNRLFLGVSVAVLCFAAASLALALI